MKLIHLSDLHLGKRVNEFSMLEDQDYILRKIIEIIDTEKPNGVMIAGDVYDKSIPSTEAVQLFDDFLVRLAKRSLKVFVISGNHDSPERIAFGAQLMSVSGVYMSPVYNGIVTPVTLSDTYGSVDIFMLPFIKPAHVRRYYSQEQIDTYSDAVQSAISHMEMNPANRNVLITHQFITGASRCESEEVSIGGADNVDASVFAPFDYTALGHLHGSQNVGSVSVHYCGTPLKYSFSEAHHEKSVTVVELFEKGRIDVRMVPLTPMRNMLVIKGKYMEITDKNFTKEMDTDSYVHVTLTDEEDIPYVIGKLRAVYPNIMKLDYDNARTRINAGVALTEDAEKKDPVGLFGKFFEQQNNSLLSEVQLAYSTELIEEIWEEAK